MTSNGKQLESLVAFAERKLLPEGFTVITNERVFNEEGIQIAEFDIEIRGRVGSTSIAWLIECRDRPTSGPAPGSWIEQLVGRRTRFAFNKVTAVSTTGFAAGAKEFAVSQGIEIREVASLSPEYFVDWLAIRHVIRTQPRGELRHSILQIDEHESPEKLAAVQELQATLAPDAAFLVSSVSGERQTTTQAFATAARSLPGLFDGIVANSAAKVVRISANYTDEDHFLIETIKGPVRVLGIVFECELSIDETPFPLLTTSEYRTVESGELISQVASFAAMPVRDMELTTEFHRLAQTGETHIVLRRKSPNA